MGPLQGPSPVSEPLPSGGHAGRHWERPPVLRLAALTPRKSFPSSPDVRRVGTVFPLLKFTKTRTQPCPQPSRRTPAEATADPGSPSPRRRVHTPDVPASSTENQGHEQREEKRHLQLSPADRGAGRGGRRGHAGLGRARRSPATDSDPSWVGGLGRGRGPRGGGAPSSRGVCGRPGPHRGGSRGVAEWPERPVWVRGPTAAHRASAARKPRVTAPAMNAGPSTEKG